MDTNLTSELQLTDGLLTDQLTQRSRNRPLVLLSDLQAALSVVNINYIITT